MRHAEAFRPGTDPDKRHGDAALTNTGWRGALAVGARLADTLPKYGLGVEDVTIVCAESQAVHISTGLDTHRLCRVSRESYRRCSTIRESSRRRCRFDVEAMTSALSDCEREILRLRFAEDLAQSEIGHRVGLSQMHISRLLRQDVTRLRETAQPSKTPA
jgi:RNA polymerase sigma factor (sigma-70 family)